MPIRTGQVTAMRELVVSRDGAQRRYDVYLLMPGFASSLPLFTTHALRASLCLEAQKTRRVVTCGTRDCRWGEEIITVELTPTAGDPGQSRSDPMGDAGEADVDPSRGEIGSVKSAS